MERSPIIKLDQYDGSTCLETYLAKFKFVSEYYKWPEQKQLLYLKTYLDGPAGELLWTQPELKIMETVVKVLQDRFGTLNQR